MTLGAPSCSQPESKPQREEFLPQLSHDLSRPIPDETPWGPPGKGLVARIWTEKTHLPVGEPVVVYYEIKNISEATIVFWHSGFWPNHLIIVKDSDGNEAPLTAPGKVRREAFRPGGWRDKNFQWRVPPGQIDRAYTPYDITEFFVMDIPGVYVVQYLYEEYQGGWEGRLLSNLLEITVAEPET